MTGPVFRRHLPTDNSVTSLHVALNRAWDAIEAVQSKATTAQVRTVQASSTSSAASSAGTAAEPSTGTGLLVRQTSPTLLGTPLAPTQPMADNSTAIATTEFVQDFMPGGAAVHQVSHGFTQGQAVYYNGSAWALAEANAIATLGIGLVIYVGVDDFYVCMLGLIVGMVGLTAGQYYFVSDATPGALTVTEPTTVGHFSNPILYATSATTGMVLPFRPSYLAAAASYASLYDFLLDCEPVSVSEAYTATWTAGVVTKEQWFIGGPVQLKSIDYTYTATLLTQEVRKVYASDGTTVLAQVTIVYTYTGDTVTSASYTRNV